ncbi:hypothetical protein COX08_01775 [Candidatus Beckwithbacteria bacterium CG23_combo_of_CG06-09_8_20_14_all_34_8]|uniref:Small-conductance mechanosensitive ion channel n=1 Tax=Candidatus Beckwithbacteria bacterium CG23_combo_of_CG06-09_8_20_14_all_34_8 TaxID=1974497 RepID=A0A2H0B6M8_9BACT|nr:MAG: hypothetical protein COX08_01775 [Candidatus Beckwithbacteria bacterium CG23_combo_of_CG06-09_8_20_14_all_34_8]
MAYYDTQLQDFILGAGTVSLISSIIPRFIGALLIFGVGFLVGKWAKKIVVKILESLNLSKLAKKTSLEAFLDKAEVKTKIEEIIGGLVKWLIVLLFTAASINMLGIPTISDVLNGVLNYVPRIVSAIFVLGIGVLLAGIIESMVKGAVGQFDVKLSRLLGKIASYIMVIIAAMAAINELGIAKELINILFIGLISMLSLGFGLAIGLGAKDLVSKILTDWYVQFKEEMEKKQQ